MKKQKLTHDRRWTMDDGHHLITKTHLELTGSHCVGLETLSYLTFPSSSRAMQYASISHLMQRDCKAPVRKALSSNAQRAVRVGHVEWYLRFSSDVAF